MHIVMLSDFEAQGGAARCASRLARALGQAGHEVTRVVGYAQGPAGRDGLHVLRLPWPERKAVGLIGRFSADGRRAAHRWRMTRSLSRELSELKPDVINVHNIHGAGWDPELITSCAAAAPVVWTLHDMWSMTGRCAYAYDCRAFVAGCGTDCPTPHEYPALAPAQIPGAWQRRKRNYEAAPGVVVVTPSQWLAREAELGMWRAHRIETIPYGVPHGIYAPAADRAALRRRLGIAHDAIVALVVAENIEERRKGIGYALEALAARSRPGLVLSLAGHARGLPEIPGLPVHRLGFLDAEAQLAAAYAAADFLLHPAPVDNLPNVVLEAMACGTPTLAFPIGGLLDMVRPGHTGWLARELSAAALGDTIDLAMADVRAGRDLRDGCVEVSRTEYTLDLQAERYTRLFSELIRGASIR